MSYSTSYNTTGGSGIITTPHQSNKEEEKVFSELTKEEQEKVLEDIYGRKQRNNNNNLSSTSNSSNNDNAADADDDDVNDDDDNDDDVTNEMLMQFDEELNDIPIESKEDYSNALLLCPDTIWENECNPIRFIRAENYDVKLAALRLVKYWEMRCDIFSDNSGDAFKPLTDLHPAVEGDNTCAMDDTISLMIERQYASRILPNDKAGRTVICFDRTNHSYKGYDDKKLAKILWFVYHVALEKRSTQKKGIVMININQTFNWDSPSRSLYKMIGESLTSCIPVKNCCTHFILSSFVAYCVLPCIQLLMPQHDKLRHQVHTNSDIIKKSSLLKTLENNFGLPPSGLPTSIGGTYTEPPIWITECETILKQKEKERRSQSDRRNKKKRHQWD